MFFGLVAVIGTTYVQVGRVTPASVVSGIAIGCLACAILVANNLRDMAGDARSGKRTLAVYLGSRRTRLLFAVLDGPARSLSLQRRRAVCCPRLALTRPPPARRRFCAGSVAQLAGEDSALTELCYAALLALGLAVSGS